MLRNGQIRITQYSDLYDKVVPQDHLLRRIKDAIDFTFVNPMLKKQYCEHYGRPATEPEKMFKLMFLKKLYDLSDEVLISNAQTDMSYKYFLDMNPEDEMIDPSLMTKFRKTRITEDILGEMLRETVRQAIDKGIIKTNTIIVDSTHTVKRTKVLTPNGVLRAISHDLRKEIYRYMNELSEEFPNKPKAESTLKEEIEYTQKLLEVTREDINNNGTKKIRALHAQLEKALAEPEIEKIRSEGDPEARVGHKATGPFYGYKNHIAMTEEGIIAGIEVTGGEVHDGKELEELVKKAEENGIEVKEIIGDQAYSIKDNLDYCAEKKIELISKICTTESTVEMNKEAGFEYNKDIGGLVCSANAVAYARANGNKLLFSFNKGTCTECYIGEECKYYKKGCILSMPNEKQQARLDKENSEYFKARLKERYRIEQKNAELKNVHGLDIADSKGKAAMKVQSFFTGVVANIKRITTLTNLKGEICHSI